MAKTSASDDAAREVVEKWLRREEQAGTWSNVPREAIRALLAEYDRFDVVRRSNAELLAAYDEARAEVKRLAKGHDEYNRVDTTARESS